MRFIAGPTTEAGSRRARHRSPRGTAAAMARRTAVLSVRSPEPSVGRAAYLARSSAMAMRPSAARAGSPRLSSLPARVATARGDSLGW